MVTDRQLKNKIKEWKDWANTAGSVPSGPMIEADTKMECARELEEMLERDMRCPRCNRRAIKKPYGLGDMKHVCPSRWCRFIKGVKILRVPEIR